MMVELHPVSISILKEQVVRDEQHSVLNIRKLNLHYQHSEGKPVSVVVLSKMSLFCVAEISTEVSII